MRPRHPEWSCITKPQLYPVRVLPKPPASFGNIQALKVGPLAIGDSQGSINNRYWVCYQDAGNVYLRGAVDDTTWSAASLIFAEAEDIEALDFTFDQLGREIIFYQVGTELRLWYFDSLASAFIKRVIDTNAEQPLAGFDLIDDTGDPMSDAHIFYAKGGTIFERLQRDRYDIVYDSLVSYAGIKLKSCGMTAGNKFQVEYVHRNQRNFLDRKKVYQTEGAVVDNFNTDNFEVGFTLGTNFNSKCAERDINGEASLTLFEQSNNSSLTADITFIVSMIYPQTGEYPILSVASNMPNLPLYFTTLDKHLFKGSYRFVFGEGSTFAKKRFRYYRDGALQVDVEFNKPLLPPDSTPYHSLKFGAADEPVSSLPTDYWRCTKAQFLNMYCIVNGVRTDWPITAGLPVVTPSVPPGNAMTVYIDGKDGVRIF